MQRWWWRVCLRVGLVLGPRIGLRLFAVGLWIRRQRFRFMLWRVERRLGVQ